MLCSTISTHELNFHVFGLAYSFSTLHAMSALIIDCWRYYDASITPMGCFECGVKWGETTLIIKQARDGGGLRQ